VGSDGWPGGFSGESGDVMVGLVELCDGLGSEELLGCDVEAVGVALDRLESRAAGLLSSRSRVLAETGASSRPRTCCSASVGVREIYVNASSAATQEALRRLGETPALRSLLYLQPEGASRDSEFDSDQAFYCRGDRI
jgi:hypothetical protein